MESKQTIIASSIIGLCLFFFGCASTPTRATSPSQTPPGTQTPGGESTTPGQETLPPVIEPQLPTVSAAESVPYYEGVKEDNDVAAAKDTTDPRKKASLNETNKGKTALNKNDFATASQHLEAAISIDPSNGFAYYYLALLQYRQGRYQESLGHLRQAKVHFSDNKWVTESHVMTGRVEEELRQWDKAAQEYESALQISPENNEAQDGLARTKGRIESLKTLQEAEDKRVPAGQNPGAGEEGEVAPTGE
ncbi:MAG TPA: tetratricopeptide repeat protein [Bdellovibrionota bacterium]|nr:tetratricopeptide repeat protein [Bdellovibrionota bacterium]